MKKLLTCLAMMLISLYSFAQQVKNDVVLKLDGDELVGKVLKINNDDIEFSYTGETLVYNIKKAEIMKITFSSGRIQVFNKPQQAAPAQNAAPASADKSSLEDHHNKVAILPFGFIRDGQPADGEQIQNECYSFMNKHSGVYTILPPRTTNALLIKAGINSETIKGYTMEDICNVLGVEYVVDGLVTMNKTTQTTTQSNSGAVKSKDDDDRKDRKYNSYSYGTATQNFQTKLSLAIYNDKGTAVYSQDRTAFWNTQDAYSNTLEYLLKRSPLYTK
ncbi:hypothetical protein [Chitinophaga rhizosphaerae]|uniref:hypothetical protein n=1 Tax=Chitinophaga rhizosphaerae TaxID=1864947 RepID=UPI000F807FBC|nr:hypothetical protein [Chitinophaga rhizosphaerae]